LEIVINGVGSSLFLGIYCEPSRNQVNKSASLVTFIAANDSFIGSSGPTLSSNPLEAIICATFNVEYAAEINNVL